MNLFDRLVDTALKNKPELASLRIVLEKELLHHDILRILSQNQLLDNLTFIGGTCLRTCYGAVRLSEDLDFNGGQDFSRETLKTMGKKLIDSLYSKYNLTIKVTEPTKDIKNVDTWKVKVETRPQSQHLPAQRIHIDICAQKSYEKKPMLLLNPYGVDMGTGGLVIQAQSQQEIYTDKLIAFALRPNRIKYRDLWDISWLHQQSINPNLDLLPLKLKDRNISPKDFIEKYQRRTIELNQDNHHLKTFKSEMVRFLPATQLDKINNSAGLWEFISEKILRFQDEIKLIL